MHVGIRSCSIIIPTLSEESILADTLQQVRLRAPNAEIIVVDGGSRDATAEQARAFAAQVLVTQPGRGTQLNAGARAARGEALLFLHADTVPDAGGIEAMLDALSRPDIEGGAFRLRFDDPRPVFGTIARQIARRSVRTRTYTGDQAIFLRRSAFEQMGGYRPWQFMEDVEMSERLARRNSGTLLDAYVTTSARRHRVWGLPKTQAHVMLIRALYMAHVHPDRYAGLWPEVRELVPAHTVARLC